MRIISINDVYELDNMPRFKTLIAAQSQGWPKENLITALAGDFLAPSLLSSLDAGAGMVRVLNDFPIDFVCFGNHESDIPLIKLRQRIVEFKGTWLNANMPDFEPRLPAYALRRLVGNSGAHGARTVAFVGLCIGGGKYRAIYRENAFGGAAAKMVPVDEAARNAYAEIKRDSPDIDEVIPLTHQDKKEDIVLAESDFFPCIIGGHDHDEVNEVHGRRGCPVIKAGQDAVCAAIVDITWSENPFAPPQVKATLEPCSKYEPDADLVHKIDKISRPVRELETAIIYELAEGEVLSSIGVRYHEASMAQLVATALRDVLHCDAAVINSGAVRGNRDYNETISYADLKRECPFPSPIVVTRMPFEVLRDAVQHSRRPWWDVPAGGRPGECASALQVDDAISTDAGHAALTIGGGAPETQKLYAIACDTRVLKNNKVLKEYCARFPDRIPPDDAGRPVLPLLAEYFCGRLWQRLIDTATNRRSALRRTRADTISLAFEILDVDQDGRINHEELRAGVERILGEKLSSNIIVEQMLSMLDGDNDGMLTRTELRHGVTKIISGEFAHIMSL